MRRRLYALGLAALAAGRVIAQQPPVTPPAAQPTPPVRPAPQPTPPRPAPLPPPADARFDAPAQVAMDSDGSGSSSPLLSATPRMIGDFPGYFGYGAYTVRYCLSGTLNPLLQNNGTNILNLPGIRLDNFAKVEETYRFAALTLSRGAFKVGENEQVRPTDRVFATYHYYHGIPTPLVSSSGVLTPTATSPIGQPGTPYVLRQTLAGTLQGDAAIPPATLVNAQSSNTNLHRETIGFEKTFLNGNASVGVRLPFFQTDQANSTNFDPAALNGFAPLQVTGQQLTTASTLDRSRVGDLSVILKYALINEFDMVVSGGLVVTAPTGGGILLSDGDRMYSTLLQPWVGAYKAWDRVFVHGFSSIAVPTDDRDVTLFFNDIGVGYFLYRSADSGLLTSITPTFECHINTPVGGDRGAGIFANDSVFFTGGIHFGLGQRAVLTLGAATPVTGPRISEIEAVAQFNWLF